MATISLPADYIEASLLDLGKKAQNAAKWAANAKGSIRLEIPEPYYHVVTIPHSPPCIAPPSLEYCSEVGILMGVLTAMKPRSARSGAKATGKPKARK